MVRNRISEIETIILNKDKKEPTQKSRRIKMVSFLFLLLSIFSLKLTCPDFQKE